jgi:hypothetical protein
MTNARIFGQAWMEVKQKGRSQQGPKAALNDPWNDGV